MMTGFTSSKRDFLAVGAIAEQRWGSVRFVGAGAGENARSDCAKVRVERRSGAVVKGWGL